MDATDGAEILQLPAAVATWDDVSGLVEALTDTRLGSVEAVVVRNAGSHGPADAARFAAALVGGARDAQRRARARTEAA